MLDLLQGRRRQGAVVNLALALAANAQPIFVISTFAAMIGTKLLKIKRLKIRNNATGINTFVHIGTGVGGVGVGFIDAIPPLWSINNTTDDYDENDLPQVQLAATITAYPDAVGAGTFDVQIEIEEV
jgi:hypothetical protein